MKRSTDVPGSPSGTNANPLHELLRHAREDGFTPEETEKLWSQLGLVGTSGGTDGANSPGAGPAQRAVGVWSAKTIAMLALGGVIATGGLAATRVHRLAWYRSAPTPSSLEEVGAGEGGAGGAAERGGVGASSGTAPNSSGDVPRLMEASPGTPNSVPRAPAPRRSVPKTGPPQPVAAAGANARGTESVGGADSPLEPSRKAGPQASASARTVEEDHPETSQVPLVAPAPAESAHAAEPSQSLPSAPAVNEGALLLRARREIGSDPNQALALTEEHARLFPAGALVPEREVLAIEALAQLGRTSDARARFAGFSARFPNSPHLTRLQSMLGR